MITYLQCPGCLSSNIVSKLNAKDYTVSQELFEIWECGQCTLRFTQEVPEQDAIGKYYQSDNYISHTDTRKGIINSLYHLVRNRTLDQKKNLIERTLGASTGKLLDIGAGTGAFASHLEKAGWQVTGLEPDEATRMRAFELHAITLHSTTSLFSHETSYDAITMWHVLEHVHDLHEYLQQIEKSLKPSGYAFIAVPNYTSKDAADYAQYWAAYDVPRHLYHFSPRSMEVLVKKHGLTIELVQPMWYDAFYVSMLSESYKNGKINYLNALMEGLASNWKAFLQRNKCSSLVYLLKKIN